MGIKQVDLTLDHCKNVATLNPMFPKMCVQSYRGSNWRPGWIIRPSLSRNQLRPNCFNISSATIPSVFGESGPARRLRRPEVYGVATGRLGAVGCVFPAGFPHLPGESRDRSFKGESRSSRQLLWNLPGIHPGSKPADSCL